ncbi:FKBP-type peptidyl-prolyl cis-trans isomerase [Candidatus Pacearchaeota archaeon]|nr:FKBP-type peptidyl-prolyl cis-trans isomerase [Candidatus Pacearchaeota archaeon]
MEKTLTKNDFIELEYSGKVKDGEIFDTNISEEIKKLNLDIEPKPMIICLGQNMILPAIDEFLIGKETGNYLLNLAPEKAFGFREKERIKIIPVSVFKKHNIVPQQGLVFQFDNSLGKITAISGGRIIVDFNNPLAGKEVIYDLRVKRKLEDINEKAKSLINYIFRMDIKFKIEGKKIILESDEKLKKFIELFKDKFKEILELELEINIVKSEEKKHEHSHEDKHEHHSQEKNETKTSA